MMRIVSDRDLISPIRFNQIVLAHVEIDIDLMASLTLPQQATPEKDRELGEMFREAYMIHFL